MAKVGELLQEGKSFLKEKKVADFQISAEELVAFFLKIKKNELFFYLKNTVCRKTEKRIRKSFRQRAAKIPLQHILKTMPFYNVELQVSSSVLIPRFETEYLVELIAGRLKRERDLQGKCLWDIGTGSGAVAIAFKKTFAGLEVQASDISRRALQTAKKNACANRVRIDFRHGDLFVPFSGQKADFIVFNPPYVAAEEYLSLQEELFHEPKRALVAGADGLVFYRRLAAEAKYFLYPKGRLFLEVGVCQAEKVKEIFDKKEFTNAEILTDLSGKRRFFFIELQ